MTLSGVPMFSQLFVCRLTFEGDAEQNFMP